MMKPGSIWPIRSTILQLEEEYLRKQEKERNHEAYLEYLREEYSECWMD